jgi:hypothetical protein
VSDRSLYTVYSAGTLVVNYGWLNDDDETKLVRDLLASQLSTLLAIEPDLDFPACPVARWKSKVDELLAVVHQTLPL